jgi:cation diffusion facilitator family transporter
MDRSRLTRFAWLSIAAGCVTFGLKTAAYQLTGSIGLLSDALESIVNLFAAVFALVILRVAALPPDESHPYGHSKAEYFASGAEGALIFLAAISIAVAAAERFFYPRELNQTGIGLLFCSAASLVNLAVSLVLRHAGRKHSSITLEADASHLLTDVWTSAGVIAGVGAVALTGWLVLDPIVALAVSANIVWTGYRLIQRSVMGLMDSSLPSDEVALVEKTLDRYKDRGVQFHALRTQRAGSRRFVSLHVLVPDRWTVREGHELVEEIEADVRKLFPSATVFTHLEPIADPVSLADQGLDR